MQMILLFHVLVCMVLNIMLDICNNFAHENCITFNIKKTVCIKFGEN